MYTVAKTYPHSLGLSAVFRQPGAKSHCSKLHGYALAFTLVFECDELDENSWCIDFGSLKPVKQYLVEMFDHKLLVARHDPMKEHFAALADAGLAEIFYVDRVGCEGFAEHIGHFVVDWLKGQDLGIRFAGTPYARPRVRLRSVTVSEHAGNSATWENV